MTGKADPDKPEEPIKVEPGQPGTTPIGGGGGEVVEKAVPPPEALEERDDG